MDALSGIGGQWTYGPLTTQSSRARSGDSALEAGASAAANSSNAGSAAANNATIADVIAANGNASSSAQLISSPGYADVMAAMARQAVVAHQALGANLDIRM